MTDLSNKQLLLIGLFFLLSSVGLYYLSYQNFNEPEQRNNIRALGLSAMNNCSENIRNQYGNGYRIGSTYFVNYSINTDNQDMAVNVGIDNLGGGMNVVKDMDIMMNMCPRMRLDYFCMGIACDSENLNSGGMEMRLIYNTPTER